jgi:hypothetical protein
MPVTASSTFGSVAPHLPHFDEADPDAPGQQDTQEQDSAAGNGASTLKELLPDSALSSSIVLQLQAKPPQQTAAHKAVGTGNAADSVPSLASSSPPNQISQTDAIRVLAATPQDTKLAASIKSLMASKDFQDIDGAAKIAVLSQVKNYPNEKVASNLERLVGKSWFKSYDSGDKQRALKLIAYMSLPRSGEDTRIVDNTLEKFLGANAPYSLKIESIQAPPGSTAFGNAANGVMTINEDLIAADNKKLEDGPRGGDVRHLALHTIPHEINHLINGDTVAPTFNYLNEEYRAWYVGQQGANGQPPTNSDAIDRWKYFLTPGSGYWGAAANAALNNSAESAKIFNELSKLTGVPVDANNYKQVLNDSSSWQTNPNAPAAVVPPGNLDNS